MLTEHISPRFVDLNSWSTSDMIEAMYDGQLVACAAVRPALPAINAAVDDAVSALKRGGRLVYVGAGTSGRIAIQDGAELRPTYDWPSDRIVFVMAGGMQAVLESVEGAEDNEAKGAEAIADAEFINTTLLLLSQRAVRRRSLSEPCVPQERGGRSALRLRTTGARRFLNWRAIVF